MRFSKEVDFILAKMCEVVGCDFDTFDFNQEGWYAKHKWTHEQEEKFKRWMVAYLQRNKKARTSLGIIGNSKTWIERGVNMFLLNYGWYTKVETKELSELGELK